MSIEKWNRLKYNSSFYVISDNLVLMGLLNFSLRKSAFFKSAPNPATLLIKAICLANIAKFFLLPIVIWKTQQSNFVVQLNFLLVIGYFICGLIHVHSGALKIVLHFKIGIFVLCVPEVQFVMWLSCGREKKSHSQDQIKYL